MPPRNGYVLQGICQRLQRLAEPAACERSDGQLLEEFLTRGHESAFAELIRRYGPLVLGVCQRVLNNAHDAEDAFQATFLILIRRAPALDTRGTLANWLYTVAYHTALRSRAAVARRRKEESQLMSPVSCEEEPGGELRPILDEELSKLPEIYRTPLVLCYLQGKSTSQAANLIGCPKGTLLARLARGRDKLRGRLERRALVLSGATLAALVIEEARAVVPSVLTENTLQAARALVAGQPLAGCPRVASLVEGALRTMWITKLKLLAGLGATIALAGWFLYQSLAGGAGAAGPGQVLLPTDPQQVVLFWESIRPEQARISEAPQLIVRADGSVQANDPYAAGVPARIELSARELQDVLRAVVHEHGFFGLDEVRVRSQLDAERQRRGLGARSLDRLPISTIRVCADGREQEIRCADLQSCLAGADANRLLAIERRLERVATLALAGGSEGVNKALAVANEQLRCQFPEAPALTADDLRTARRADNQVEITFERRGLAEQEPFSFVYARVEQPAAGAARVTVKANLQAAQPGKPDQNKRYLDPINLEPKPIAKDNTVVYDYDIVYVRAPRQGDKVKPKFAEVGDPRTMDAGADLVVLHPDGAEEVIVPVEPHESIADPFVSFDGQWVYYAKMHDALKHKGADIYKVHVKSRKIVRLTEQKFTPNTGAADWSKTPLPSWGVYNLGPTPVPGGKVCFVSDRNAFRGTNTGYAPNALALQLFIMDDDGQNVECIGHLNLGMALHPVILKDGRIMFSSLESQGLRSHHLWGIWAINPDGSNWGPLVSAFDQNGGTTDSFHFQTQLSDSSIVFESYYNLNNHGMGLYFKQPIAAPEGYPPFGPGNKFDPRNPPLRNGRLSDGRPITVRFPFSAHGIETLTPFIHRFDAPSEISVLGKPDSPRVGKFTHPSGAPDNHLLTAWATGAVNSVPSPKLGPAVDCGIYLIKSGKPIDEPGQMVLIKNDPNYNEQWPRALVPYKRIYGIDEPPRLAPLANDGKRSKLLPEGTPYGLVGTSSLYKRESYPYGGVPKGGVTAGFAEDKDPQGDRGITRSHNWNVQGAEAGLYKNDDVHAIRILLLEPNTDRQGGPKGGRLFFNHAKERMRILGEFPVRKFDARGNQPLDPDGNPDTSFLTKIPADMAWTFQTLDKHGMVLNSAQTWHQVRPGEIRNDCGGCHAHSQQPTPFEKTAAAQADYVPFDLTRQTPLITSKKLDQSGKKWDKNDETGVRFASGPQSVEFHRDVKPILQRSCVACHTKAWDKPAGNLVLDDDSIIDTDSPVFGPDLKVPGSYMRLAADSKGKFGHKPLHRHGWTDLSASRYVKLMQSRRSLLIWKVYGERLDGWVNDDFVHEAVPGDPKSLRKNGQPVADTTPHREAAQVAFLGSAMPPPAAVQGSYTGPKGEKIKVDPLSDEERRTLVRWIDLGCPIDFDFDPAKPAARGFGWLLDDVRPTLTLAQPVAGVNKEISRLLIGMHDYDTGLDVDSLKVTADFAIDGVAPGQNLAGKFTKLPDQRWELKLDKPITNLERGKLTVSIKDKQGNLTQIERTIAVSK